MKKLLLATVLFSGMMSNAHAIVERQNINMIANIQAPSLMEINPTAGAWPSIAQVVSWSPVSKTFTNPTPIGFTVKSTADVTLSLASTPALVDGLAHIPLKVEVNSTAGIGENLSDVTLLPQAIYKSVNNNNGTDAAAFTVAITAKTTGMLDQSGIPGITEPAPGSYTGVVSLVFESNI